MASEDNSFVNGIKRFVVLSLIIFVSSVVGSYIVANYFVFGSFQLGNFFETIKDPNFKNIFSITFILASVTTSVCIRFRQQMDIIW